MTGQRLRMLRAYPEGTRCRDCGIARICLPVGFPGDTIERLEAMVDAGAPYPAGTTIYTAGAPLTHLYALKSGTAKTAVIDESGREHVTGFYLPGELIGLDGIAAGVYPSTAVAVEDCRVCAVDHRQLSELRKTIPELSDLAVRMLSDELARSHDFFNCLSRNSAEAKVAAFLLNLSARRARRRLDDSDFELPMSRHDIGAYLGLAVESVSRAFTRLAERGAIERRKRHVRIIDREALLAVSGKAEA